METEKLCDGLELSATDDVEYIVAYRKENEHEAGVATKCSGMDLMGLSVAIVVNILNELRDPMIHASFFAAMFDAVKHENVLNPIVDLAVSYDGRVLRSGNE